MQVNIKETGPLTREITVIVPKAKADKEFTDFYTRIQDKAEVAGFRKGNAPISVLRIRFADMAQSEVSSRLIYNAVNDLISEFGIKIVGNPAIVEAHRATEKRKFVGEFKLDGTFMCTVAAEIEPQLANVDVSDLTISENLPNLDKWITDKLESFQYTFAERVPVSDRASQFGDEVVVDYEVSHNGAPIEDTKVEFLTITLQDTDHELDKNLVNRPAKEEFSFTVNYAADHLDAKLAGKEVVYKCFIHNITQVKPHELNDDLAKMASYTTVDELRADLAVRGAKDYVSPLRIKLFTEIMDQALAKNVFEVPTAWVNAEASLTLQRLGMKDIPTDVKLIENLKEVSTRVVKQNFVLDKVYENDKSIHLSAEELHSLLETEGRGAGMTPEKLLSALKANGQYEGFISFFEHNRTIDFLLNSAKVRNV